MAVSTSAFRVCTRDGLADLKAPSFVDLIHEWVDLNESWSSCAAVQRWGVREQALAGITTVGEIPLFVDEADAEAKDDVLAALVRLAQAGESLAARTVLQCMLPALSKVLASRPSYLRSCELSGGRAPADRRDAEHFVVSECWMLIMNYPLDRRPRKIAANLMWDTKKHAVATPRADPPIAVSLNVDGTLPSTMPRNLAPSATSGQMGLEEVVCADRELELFSRDLKACLDWALDHRILEPSEASLLGDAFLDCGFSREFSESTEGRRSRRYLTLAEERGVSYATLVKQISRAKKRLVLAIEEEILQPRRSEAATDQRVLCIS